MKRLVEKRRISAGDQTALQPKPGEHHTSTA
jgi:hypothetical protein